MGALGTCARYRFRRISCTPPIHPPPPAERSILQSSALSVILSLSVCLAVYSQLIKEISRNLVQYTAHFYFCTISFKCHHTSPPHVFGSLESRQYPCAPLRTKSRTWAFHIIYYADVCGVRVALLASTHTHTHRQNHEWWPVRVQCNNGRGAIMMIYNINTA